MAPLPVPRSVLTSGVLPLTCAIGVTNNRSLAAGMHSALLPCLHAVSVRQPVVVNTYKTRDTPTTTSRIDSSDEFTEKYQEFASTIKVRACHACTCQGLSAPCNPCCLLPACQKTAACWNKPVLVLRACNSCSRHALCCCRCAFCAATLVMAGSGGRCGPEAHWASSQHRRTNGHTS